LAVETVSLAKVHLGHSAFFNESLRLPFSPLDAGSADTV
jgi:hypothetical protein